MTIDPHAPAPDDCASACDTDRREFLRQGLMAVAALTAVAGTAPPLHALARTYASGIADGDTLTYPVPAQDGATIDARNKVVLVRYRGNVHAFALECPHRGESVQWQPQNDRFYCPKHKSTFKPEGTLIQGKAERGMDRYAVRVQGDEVVVDTSTVYRSDRNAAAWAAATAPVD